MSLFQATPYSGNQYASMGEALDTLKAFNALHAYSQAGDASKFENPDEAASWRKLVWEGVINTGGEPMELDFFEKIFGGTTEVIDAKKIYFRYKDDPDHNIYAQESAQAAAGAEVTFTLAKGNHSGNGKYSYPVKGFQIYIYEDNQNLTITDVIKTNDYAHVVKAVPHKKNYAPRIRKGKKILVVPVRFTGGLSGPMPSSNLQSVGYTNHVTPFRIRADWELAVDLMRGYEEVLQWAVMFDEAGREVDAWQPYIKGEKRVQMKLAKNLVFFLGQSIDNPTLIGDGNDKVSADYKGFDGYRTSVQYAGGTLIDFYPEQGFDLKAHYEPYIVRNDARKRTTEYIVHHSKLFWMGMTNRFNERVKLSSGQCTFETFKRMGADQQAIKQLGVKSYEYANNSLHFYEMSALTDSRLIGNHQFAHSAHFLPGVGLRDSRGNEIPAVQFFRPKGMGETGMMEEHDRDLRKIDGWDKLAGHMAETIMATTHAPHLHMMAVPYMSV